MNKNSTFLINKQLKYKVLDDQVVILDEHRAEVRELNDVASHIFIKISQGSSLEEISQELSDEYEVSQKQALQDTIEFATMYLDQGYLIKK